MPTDSRGILDPDVYTRAGLVSATVQCLEYLEEDVAHVHLEPARVIEHTVLGDHLGEKNLFVEKGQSFH